jgi:hypothetical protein
VPLQHIELLPAGVLLLLAVGTGIDVGIGLVASVWASRAASC